MRDIGPVPGGIGSWLGKEVSASFHPSWDLSWSYNYHSHTNLGVSSSSSSSSRNDANYGGLELTSFRPLARRLDPNRNVDVRGNARVVVAPGFYTGAGNKNYSF